MKVLLIGGTGVLSTDICKLCLKKGYQVTSISRGYNPLFKDNSVEQIIGDARDKKAMSILSDRTFDVVVDFISFNVDQLKKVLEIFDKRFEQYIFFSSATAYIKTDKKIKESDKLENNDWTYASDKIACENYLKEYFSKTKQKYTIVRPYITYGQTRIPYAIIPSKQWTLVNRILIGKPILIWDEGKNVCTLTHTTDFAVGLVGLFLNKQAYNEDFHITTTHTQTWSEALDYIGDALGKKVIKASLPTDFIVTYNPELRGVLIGDKAHTRIFDNSKIKKAVPEFKADITFEKGIKWTIENYKENKNMQEIDYAWDGEIDYLISRYYKKYKIKPPFSSKALTSRVYKNISFKNRMHYCLHRYPVCRKLYKLIRG